MAVAALLFASSANAHMIMASPVPFSVDKLDNAPITAAQYPCKINLGFTVSTMNNMKVGEEQTLSFKGSAVHGGGSCQLSVTTDKTPTANSKFKVIMSMEGGCPGIDGPLTFKYKIPDSVPNGQVTLAWTWFSRLSGQPELYMNCAPLMVTGGASDTKAFDALPDMFVANIATAQCTTPANFNTKFPNPGQNVLTDDSAAAANPPTGAGCGKAVSGGGDASSAAGGAPTSVAATSAAEAPSNTGGVFAPGASSAAPAESTSTLTTLVTLTASPSVPAAATSAPAAGTEAPASGTEAPAAGTSAAAAPVPTTPSGGGGGATCSTNGAVVCNGATQFGLCDNGKVVWQAVAAGTTCSNGQITKRQWRRELRGRVPLKPETL
ncbi:uncharacterized protein BDZ99DRAFT_377685 [Mytilinidion resinicola]|uniref:Lytic polysaccharide monooxygenase n=1 Tax=Mytilinidion resinicola TaxID=574789 RepID=A0A6A6Z2T2_9PEZI|nr:uncharacterized protein BDZ99DRAFT_377685 [Mytilinidion resinicola]KAF2814993.1 hypothetical protein BDZ99DRAFT_377685 [Mytilinidion resinicola]